MLPALWFPWGSSNFQCYRNWERVASRRVLKMSPSCVQAEPLGCLSPLEHHDCSIYCCYWLAGILSFLFPPAWKEKPKTKKSCSPITQQAAGDNSLKLTFCMQNLAFAPPATPCICCLMINKEQRMISPSCLVLWWFSLFCPEFHFAWTSLRFTTMSSGAGDGSSRCHFISFSTSVLPMHPCPLIKHWLNVWAPSIQMSVEKYCIYRCLKRAITKEK